MAKARHYSHRPPSQRQLRVGELIRRALSEILTRAEISDPALERQPVTITEVRSSVDLKIADVYFFPLGGKEVEEITAAFSAHRGELRKLVARKLALKYAPQLRFHLERSFDQIDEMQRLLDTPDVRRDLEIK